MAVIWALFIGLIVGVLAKLVMPGRDPGGVIVTALIGVAGSVGAYFIGRAAGFYTSDGPGIIASLIGAVLVLMLYRLAKGGGGASRPV